MRRGLICLLSFFSLGSLPAQVIYVSTLNRELHRLDIENCTHEFVADLELDAFDISFHPNGNLYGIAGDGSFYEIDTLTGATNILHQFEGQTFNSLTIARDGIVYTTGSKGELWSYDFNSGIETYLGNIGHSATGDLTFYEGNLYAAVSLNRILLVDIEDPENSVVVIDEKEDVIDGNFAGNVIGIVSFAEDCQDINTYAITYKLVEGVETSAILQIDFSDNSLSYICELGIVAGGGASTFEFFASSPIVLQEINITSSNCGQDNGRITLAATGGNGQIRYSVDGIQFQEAGIFDKLLGGSYPTFISDGECTIDTLLAVNQTDCPIHIPSAFSPNGDGINDEFGIFPHPDFSGEFKRFQVYNRWGKLVYATQSSDPDELIWDGRNQGKTVAEGVYLYVVEYVLADGEPQYLQGSITVIK